MTPQRLCLVATILLSAYAAGFSDDWPGYRGPARNGISKEMGWSAESPKVLWTASIGAGWTSVAVVGERVYTAGNRDANDVVTCLDCYASNGRPYHRSA